MRQFKIINAVGAEFDLNSLDSFLVNPDGLGYSNDSDFENVGYDYYITSTAISQPKPHGTIKFTSYERYLEFIKFIQREPLKLCYTAAEAHYLDCVLGSLSKGEIESRKLSVTIQLIGISQWYKYRKEAVGSEAVIGKYYPYQYAYTYTDKAQGDVHIVSDSALDSPAKLTILGPCTNPKWVHYVNNKKESEGRVIATIPDNHRLVVSSEYPFSIKEYDEYNNEIADRYEDSDFETERFVFLKHGENKVSFMHDGNEEMNATAEGKIYYVSV